MLKPPIPRNEEARLEELMDYLILDTPAEETFDLIAQLAAMICEVPTSLITFISRDRQWFKSVNSQVIKVTETSRDVAFCSYTILSDELMEVPDALEDPRFSANPLVTGQPNIRFYAGAPLTTQSGCNLGSLCVISDQPKVLSENQKTQLMLLAKVTMKMLDVRKSLTQKEEESWRIQESNKIKELLMANMSHELITPLNAVVGYAQLLDHDLEDSKQPEQRELVDHILERSSYLLRMITNILEFSGAQIDSLEFHYEPAQLNREIKEVLLSFRKALNIKKIGLNIEMTPQVIEAKIDRYWFKQIINCYVSNAIEISPIEGQIILRLKAETPGWLYLELEDKHSRLDLSDIEKLFSRDEQMHSSLIKKYPGIGLNLLLVKQVVEAQGGKVAAQNLLNKGCIFNATIRTA